MSKEKQIEIKVITYEEQRLKYFSDLLKNAQARYKRLVRKHKDAHYLTDEFQKICDVSGEICFLEEVVDMLEYGYHKQSEGEWESFPSIGNKYRCSLCKAKSEKRHNFCSNCGAKMKGGAE